MKQKQGIYKKFIKRLLDVVLSLMSIAVLLPVLLGVAFLVRIKLGKPVFFTQDRTGKKERNFKIYKFRSMTNHRDPDGKLLPDEVRLTSFGKKLRETSLDELPGLWNVLKGDMSFIGPRPLLVSYLPLYNDRQARRHEVRPGLTGLAQINGRNAVDWSTRFEYDVQYVDNVTFLNDIKILLKTVKIVLKRDGVSSESSVTMEPFKGNS